MQRWLVVRAGYVQPYIDALFITISGQPANSQVLRSVIDELREKSGVDVSLKRLRDTYGVTLIGNNMPPEQVTQFWTRPDFNLTSGVVPLKTDAVSPLPCLDRCPELHRRLEDTHALERNVYPVLDI